MTIGWQDFVATSAASACALYLLVRVTAFLRQRESAGCGGGCASCPAVSPEAKAPAGFVAEGELGEFRRPKTR